MELTKQERLNRIVDLADSILEQLVEDRTEFRAKDLKQAAELLARCVKEIAKLQSHGTGNTLYEYEAAINKLRVSYNILFLGKEKKTMANESVS
ncbi:MULTISPECIES: hypothetical protein [Bacillaceae]|uniref:Uncharacterized protein n=1 Tax=Bacillus infantis NRRL B-14911 TaxID=1367477 RepID=U5L708_9BACI|nr:MULTISPECIES: hypothetical protein [Bacillus]OXT16507.1 hypothetical protein B9K06_15265 [Bacillus sp. OG2]AGX03629.1 hypothetical protein N288_08530 [Bacillus infantis NRRL B-14911]EAR65074.1 hypothetical protein B14911_22222 [Bacillus sp. NRRL B-14911]MCA1034471.1 hypothetical protein [Bacillus infantis]MCK6204082.1 hypothetical protein [Bacillus infantis]